MKNIVKYVGLILIIILLMSNSFMLNKIIKQNNENQAQIAWINQLVNNIESSRNTYQTSVPVQAPPKEVMTPLDLANYLGIDMDKVYIMVEDQATKIPFLNIDGEYKFSKAAIDEWMKSTNVISTRK